MEEKMLSRLNKVGGEAVIEGVMMKAGTRVCTACRDENGKIKIHEREFVSVRKKHRFLNLPILRGVVNFIEMMILSFSVLSLSADVMANDEEVKESSFEKWCKKHLGVRLFDIIMAIASVIGVILALFLFLYLPSRIAELINRLADYHIHSAGIAGIEGVMKIGIFIAYISLVSLMPDMRRVFQYHGAEHKSIACFESGEDLTPENAKLHTRFHPRCGTSFMFVMIFLGVLIGFAIHLIFPSFHGIAYGAVRLLLLPLVVGIGFEFIMYAGKHDNALVRALSAPGLWMQRITTREPDLGQLEVAITALKSALLEEFPDFDISSYEKIKTAKEKKTEENSIPADETKKPTGDDATSKDNIGPGENPTDKADGAETNETE